MFIDKYQNFNKCLFYMKTLEYFLPNRLFSHAIFNEEKGLIGLKNCYLCLASSLNFSFIKFMRLNNPVIRTKFFSLTLI